jgi:uncharacterized protein HemX
MTMKSNIDSDIVAEKARETFNRIKMLRKTMPQFTRSQKDELKAKIKEAQDQWWEEVKQYMRKS